MYSPVRRPCFRSIRWVLLGLAAFVSFLLLIPTGATALDLTIDQIIFQQTTPATVNPGVLAGTASITLSGSTLTLVLTNTSSGATGGPAATNLLTGIGFVLPTGVTINAASSSVSIPGGSTAIGFTAPITDTRWGVDNGVTGSGPFATLASVNTAVGTVQSMIDADLVGTPVGGKGGANVNGPDYGLLSSALLSSTCSSGLQCVQNSLTFSLVLSGTINSGTLLDTIQSGQVVLAFGSPNSVGAVVPEPATVLLLGSGLAGFGVWRWSRRKGAEA